MICKLSFIFVIQGTDTKYLNEIRICFDKDFEVINCGGSNGISTNCGHKDDIYYLK